MVLEVHHAHPEGEEEQAAEQRAHRVVQHARYVAPLLAVDVGVEIEQKESTHHKVSQLGLRSHVPHYRCSYFYASVVLWFNVR